MQIVIEGHPIIRLQSSVPSLRARHGDFLSGFDLTDIEMRRLNECGIAHLQWLMKTVHNANFSHEYLTKKFDHSYLGMKPLAVLSYSDDKVVGACCSIPQKFRSANGPVLSAHLCDFYTAESHQRQGLNTRMTRHLAEIAKSEGVRFFTVFHSAATFKTSRSIGFSGIGNMQGYIIRTGGIPWQRAVLKIKKQTGPTDKQINRAIAPYLVDSAEYRNSNANSGGVWHDYNSDFFAYKSFTHNFHIRLKGVTFWIQIGGAMLIGDVSFDSNSAFVSALEELKILSRRLGLRTIIFQVWKNSTIDRALRENYDPFESWPVEYLDLDPEADELNLNKLKMNYGDLDTF